MGAAPLAQAGPGTSALFVAAATQTSVEQAVELLCGGCTPILALEDAVVNGIEAKIAVIGGKGSPVVEWVFVQQMGKLVFFSIHDPESLKTLDGVIQTFSFSPEPIGPATVQAAQMARQWLAINLDVNPCTLVIASAEAFEWPDTCLGVPTEGESCAQAMTAGYIGMLQNRTAQYEYRVDQTGNNVRVTPGAVLSARQMIAQQLRIDPAAVTIASFEKMMWVDRCLGTVVAGEACAEDITPGYRVVLVAAGQYYEVHTDESGGTSRLASAPEPELADAAITWMYESDESCETATFGSNVVEFGYCGAALILGQYVVPERAEAFTYFVQTYAPFEAETPAGQLSFTGQGTTVATLAEQRMIAEWARLTALEARAGRSGASFGLALVWHREGGVTGFCDDLMVYVTGEVFASSCQGEQSQALGYQRLTTEQLEQLYAWIDEWKAFEFSASDSATPDALTVYVVFSGVGSAEATEADQQALQEWAAQLITGFGQ
jgi:hypothetical protein